MISILAFQLAVYISEQVPELVIGDPGRFRQIITNLMGNSIKVSNKQKDKLLIVVIKHLKTAKLCIFISSHVDIKELFS